MDNVKMATELLRLARELRGLMVYDAGYSIDNLMGAVGVIVERIWRKMGLWDGSDEDETAVVIIKNKVGQWFEGTNPDELYRGKRQRWSALVFTNTDMREAERLAAKIAKKLADVEDVNERQFAAMVAKILGPKKTWVTDSRGYLKRG